MKILLPPPPHFQFASNVDVMYTCADPEGGSGGSGPPLEFAKLIIADINGNEKLVIFHICALPQLYVKVGPPLEKFSGSAPVYIISFKKIPIFFLRNC